MMSEKPYFSTQDIGRLLNVSLSSVSKWIDKGELKAYLTPGGYRRVKRGNLVEFMKRYKMPIPPELEPLKRKVLIVDHESRALKTFSKLVKTHNKNLEVEVRQSAIEGLLYIGTHKPHVVLLDMVMPNIDSYEFCQKMKENPETRGIKIIAITGDSGVNHRDKPLKADAFYSKGQDIHVLLELIDQVLANQGTSVRGE